MAFAHVQGDATTGASASAASLAFTVAATTINDLVVVHITTTSTTRTLSSVTDNAGTPNPYNAAIGPIDSSTVVRVWQAYGVQVTGGATSITVNLSASAGLTIAGDEFSGNNATLASVLGVTGSGSSAGVASNSAALGSAIAPTAGNLVVFSLGGNASIAPGLSAGAGYTLGGRNTRVASGYKLSATASESPAPSWTTATTWVLVACEYKVPGATAVSDNPRNPMRRVYMPLLAA